MNDCRMAVALDRMFCVYRVHKRKVSFLAVYAEPKARPNRAVGMCGETQFGRRAMDAKVPGTLHVDVFQLQFVDIADVDIDKLQTLSIAVRWPHRADDWQYLREIGRGLVGLDEIGRVIGSVMWFPHGDRFATIGMLITSPRLQTNGTAKWLTERALAECRGRKVRLNATREARRLYGSLSFSPQKTVFQLQGNAVGPTELRNPRPGTVLRQLERGDLDAIVTLDAPAFGVPRPVHIRRLFDDSLCYGLFEDGRLRAYSMSRRFGRGHVVGPVVASEEADAIAVVGPHMREHAGKFLRLDTHFESGEFANFVKQCGLSIFDTVTTMTLGENADYGSGDADQSVVFALASQTMG